MSAASRPSPPTSIPWLNGLLAMPDRREAALALASKWLDASLFEREHVARGWNWGGTWLYPTIGRLACTTGEHGTALARIRAVLVLSWLDDREVSREKLVLYCELYHSCLFAGLDPAVLLATVGQTLPASGGDSILQFLGRSEQDKSLSAFGFSAGKDSNGEWELSQTG